MMNITSQRSINRTVRIGLMFVIAGTIIACASTEVPIADGNVPSARVDLASVESDEITPDETETEYGRYQSSLFGYQFEYETEGMTLDTRQIASATTESVQGERLSFIPLELAIDLETGNYTELELPPLMAVRVTPNPDQQSIDAWVEQQSPASLPWRNIQSTTVAGEPAISAESDVQYRLRHVVFASPDNTFIVELQVPITEKGDIDDDFESTYRQVTETFTFVESDAE